MKTAIFGGTFDPVHTGHVKMVQSAIEQFGLDKLVIVPNANPPHKRNEVTADFFHRYNMLCLAFRLVARTEISDYESRDSEYHYSLYTMRHFREVYGEDTYFIIGADSLCTLHLWHESARFLKENRFIVFMRGNDREAMKVYRDYEKLGVDLQLADMPFFDASSTGIRKELSRGRVPGDILSPDVTEYIREHKLYGGRI